MDECTRDGGGRRQRSVEVVSRLVLLTPAQFLPRDEFRSFSRTTLRLYRHMNMLCITTTTE
jgi:hypothetical protein